MGKSKTNVKVAQTLQSEMTALLNTYSEEQYSNTPDYILADYLLAQLDLFATVVTRRDANRDITTLASEAEDIVNMQSPEPRRRYAVDVIPAGPISLLSQWRVVVQDPDDPLVWRAFINSCNTREIAVMTAAALNAMQ